ncbi:sugar ABC transporter permease [Mycoplasmatota bacterium]|nr:sugar ABC transporter permease [Mycoplasmatota bacterium]
MNRLKKINSAYLFILPYVTMFLIFIVLPVFIAFILSFTYFNAVEAPEFNGVQNYIYILTQDKVFMQTILPNTIKFSLIVGPGGYILSFLLAWILAQVPHKPRTILALMIYSPSMTAGVAITVLWQIIFSGDEKGLINGFLINYNFISEPIQWLQSPDHLMMVMIIVSLWSSMGVGFLAMLAGVLNINTEVYEAAYIDGLRNKFQEIFYITMPSMKPQMLFGAVMSIVGTFSAGAIGVQLSGANPTPQNSGQLIVNHIEDYGILRSEMGLAAAFSVVLLIIIYGISKYVNKLLND